MPTIKRKVEIVSVEVNCLSDGDAPQFTQLLRCWKSRARLTPEGKRR